MTLYFVVGEGIFGPLVRLNNVSHSSSASIRSYYTAEASFEEVMMRLKKGGSVSSHETLFLNGGHATTTISGGLSEREVSVRGDFENNIRKLSGRLALGSGASFNFGVHSHVGGMDIKNTASVKGNVYSNGPVIGSNSNIIRGDVISAGTNGLIDGVMATGTARAKTIKNSNIGRDAYYQTLTNTTVSGTKYPSSPNQPTADLPIVDDQIEEWKAQALAGGVINSPCPYIIQGAMTLGPKKINCDLEIKGNNYELTLGGPIWVAGDIKISNSPTLRAASSLGNNGVAVIADKENDRANKGRIILDNSSQFFGTGQPNSYIMFLSQNNSAENGGSVKAIEAGNSARGDLLLYAGHGEIVLKNSIKLNQVTGYRLTLENSTIVEYETGLASILFDSGPGGTWNILSWRESE